MHVSVYSFFFFLDVSVYVLISKHTCITKYMFNISVDTSFKIPISSSPGLTTLSMLRIDQKSLLCWTGNCQHWVILWQTLLHAAWHTTCLMTHQSIQVSLPSVKAFKIGLTDPHFCLRTLGTLFVIITEFINWIFFCAGKCNRSCIQWTAFF